jgi:hypothetical protein
MTEVSKDLLNYHNVIITARPYAVNMPGLSPFDLELEPVWFRQEQVQEYLTKAVAQWLVGRLYCDGPCLANFMGPLELIFTAPIWRWCCQLWNK